MYDRLAQEAEKTNKENEKRRLALLEEEKLQCTFTPQLSKAFNHHHAGSASRESDVFDRLAETPTAALKVRREDAASAPADGTPVKAQHTRQIPVLNGAKKSKIPVASGNGTPVTTGSLNGGSNGTHLSHDDNAASSIDAHGMPSDAELASGLAQAMAEMVVAENADKSADVEDNTEVDEGDDAALLVKTENIVL